VIPCLNFAAEHGVTCSLVLQTRWAPDVTHELKLLSLYKNIKAKDLLYLETFFKRVYRQTQKKTLTKLQSILTALLQYLECVYKYPWWDTRILSSSPLNTQLKKKYIYMIPCSVFPTHFDMREWTDGTIRDSMPWNDETETEKNYMPVL